MSKTPFVIFGIFAAICLLGLPAWALTKEGSEDAAEVTVAASAKDGKELFANNCGACHTLAAAGTDGVVGPDLDTLPSFTDSAADNADHVRTTIETGIEGRMPAGILDGEQAKQVADFVGEYTAKAQAPPPAPVPGS